MDPQGSSVNPRLRIADADRDRAATVINNAMAEGRLTADEHSDRLDAIYQAKTHADIVPLLDDLPGTAAAVVAPAPVDVPAEPGHTDHIVAILSGEARKGAWHANPVTDIVTVMGGVELDFREALLPGREIRVRAVCIMGGVEITVPPEMRVIDSGFSFLGGRQSAGDTADSLQPGAPVLRITGTCIMGGIEIKRKARPSAKGRRDAIDS
jgi:hypothetical protein